MIRLISIISLLIMAQSAYSQVIFQRSYGGEGNEYGRAVIECSTGGYLVVGSTNSYFNPSTDVYLLRVDENGDYIWGRNIGEANKIDWGIDLVEDSEGNFFIAGYTDDSPTGSYDGLLIKTDSEGQVIWKKTFGGDDWDFIEGMALTNTDEIILAGSKTENGMQKGWILKTDNNGEVLWEEVIESSSQLKITGVDVCDDQSIVFIGYDSNSLLETKKFVAGTLDIDGGTQWISVYPEFGKIETGKCHCSDNFQFYSVGTLFNEDNTAYIHVNSLNYLNGALVWSQNLEQPDGFGNGITQKSNGIVYFVGTIGSIGFNNTYSANINSFAGDGDFAGVNQTAIQGGYGTDELFDIIATNDGGLAAVGQSNSFGNGYQVHLCKLDSLNNRNDENTDFLDLATTIISREVKEAIKIFPNPAQDYIYLSSEESTNYTFKITGIDGKQFSNGSLKDQPNGIDIRNLASGLFILKLYESGELKSISRFVKLP